MLAPATQEWFNAWLQHQNMMAQQNQQRMQQLQAWQQTPPGQAVANPLLGRAQVPALAQGNPFSATMMQMMGQQAGGS